MGLFCLVAPQYTYRDWLSVVIKTVEKHTHTKIKKLILKLLIINTSKSSYKECVNQKMLNSKD